MEGDGSGVVVKYFRMLRIKETEKDVLLSLLSTSTELLDLKLPSVSKEHQDLFIPTSKTNRNKYY